MRVNVPEQKVVVFRARTGAMKLVDRIRARFQYCELAVSKLRLLGYTLQEKLHTFNISSHTTKMALMYCNERIDKGGSIAASKGWSSQAI